MQALVAYRPADPCWEEILGTRQRPEDDQHHLGWVVFTLVAEDVQKIRGYIDWFDQARRDKPDLVNAAIKLEPAHFQFTLYEQCPGLSRAFDDNRDEQDMFVALNDTVNVSQIEGVRQQDCVVEGLECDIDENSVWFSFYIPRLKMTVTTDRVSLDLLTALIRPIAVED